jgi:hypothetical protein
MGLMPGLVKREDPNESIVVGLLSISWRVGRGKKATFLGKSTHCAHDPNPRSHLVLMVDREEGIDVAWEDK